MKPRQTAHAQALLISWFLCKPTRRCIPTATMLSTPPLSAISTKAKRRALSLAHALGCGVLMDERRGRQTARRQGVPLFGVLGVLLQAKRIGKIECVAPTLDRMQANGYRISQPLINAALHLAGEAV